MDISIALPRTTSFMILLFAAGIPMPALAQIGVVVEGRVYDARSGSGIQNAVVTLEGHGSTLSSGLGTFRFSDVEPGDYILRAQVDNWAATDSGSGDQCCWTNGYVRVTVRE